MFRSMAEALAETKENMVLGLYRILTVDLVHRIKVNTSAHAGDHTYTCDDSELIMI
jgi:hypothetical protein